VQRPSVQGLSNALRSVSIEIAKRLAKQGFRTWIVGGAVRDLALSCAIKDVDLVSAAPPEVIEREFLRTIPIGREFGTMVIHVDGIDVEHTTFRTEDAYTDARRPDSIGFGSTPEEDATRRDFRCNALYLDPLSDEVRDPTGGLADLAARRLTCVGDPARRFAEDGLRIVRLARFSGQLGLAPTPETIAAARATLSALRGVSRERLRVEFEHMLTRGGVVHALEILFETGAAERVLPGTGDVAWLASARALFAHLPSPPGIEIGFATLFDGVGSRPAVGLSEADLSSDSVASRACPPNPVATAFARASAQLESLRPSKSLLEHVRSAWTITSAMEAHQGPSRAQRVRWMRRASFETALALALARAQAGGFDTASLAELHVERASLEEHHLRPEPLVVASDLAERGFMPGPLYGIVLFEAETEQLDGRLQSRIEAMAWLARRLQDGGNDRRKA